MAVAKAGAPVTLVGAIGSDGDWVLNGLKQLGVDVSQVILSEEVSLHMFSIVLPNF